MHLKHHNIQKYCGRPDNFEEQIISNWKEKVKPEDFVLDLGDVALLDPGNFAQIIKTLPGHKCLMMGNHDKKPRSHYLQLGYQTVIQHWEIVQVGNLCFSHHPVPLFDCASDILYSISGHVHNNGLPEGTDPRGILTFALEYEGYSPKLLKQFLQEKGAHESTWINLK